MAPHVFSKVRGTVKNGHVEDTAFNRKIITETFSNERNYMLTNSHGSRYYAKWLGNGQEAWARIDNGIVKSAGINGISTNLKFFNKAGFPINGVAEKHLGVPLVVADVVTKTSNISESTSSTRPHP